MLNIEQQDLKVFAEKSYLDYAMYVILDRALPHIGDGLKPVQRRIVYAMSELHLNHQAKHKKSARTVGDVLGKYHPHGDAACYEAMVLMAQSFSYRYPLIDGQGNWGSPDDPKSFAAMRYTESKLSKYSDILLAELGEGTVEWLPNFDGTMLEPAVLPARLPNLLLNGVTGIAVGMATDMPPHNLTEVANAVIGMLENKITNPDELCTVIQGPDFPTTCKIITALEEIKNIYATGNGLIRARAIYEIKDNEVIITGLPYLVSGNKILEQIALQMQSKKLPNVVDLRDDSDHENPTRIVIVTKANLHDQTLLMEHLFATTDLERSYKVNFNVIGLNGKPEVKNLFNFLSEWLEFRQNTVTNKYQYRLNKVNERLHVLEGYLIAYLNLDTIIAIIRNSDTPKEELIKKFKLSDIQVNAILDLKLRSLAKLEEHKIKIEIADLQKEQQFIESVLSSKTKLKKVIIDELKQDIKTFGDARNCPLDPKDSAKKVVIKLVKTPNYPVTIYLSQKGWVRMAKGHDLELKNLQFKTGDKHLDLIETKSNEPVVFICSSGRSYSVLASTLPSVRGYGEPITSKITLPVGAKVIALVAPKITSLLCSSNGYGFMIAYDELITKNKKGKKIFNVKKDASLDNVIPIYTNHAQDKVVFITNELKMLILNINDIPVMLKGSGKRLINILAEETLQDVIYLPHNAKLAFILEKKTVTATTAQLNHYLGNAGQRGLKLEKSWQKYKAVKAM